MTTGPATNGKQPGPSDKRASSIHGNGNGASSAVSIPDHQLLRCIGKGSYGGVWLAQNTMGIYRAVKIIHRNSFEDKRPFERELSGIRKFEPISRSHEGFVDVLHVGINEEGGYFYYVMELGDDRRLGQSIEPETYEPKTLAYEISQSRRLSVQASLELGLALSLALHELHRNSLVHRDIKPSNIIFVNGVPKLADIGLVAEISEARSYVGTEGFIPPEGPGTRQADVYGLGKVLYEASTGRDRHEFPELPAEFDRLPDYKELLELDEVILQACNTNVAKRYKTAWDMHADLVALANGKSIKRLKALERRWSKLKRVAGLSLVGLAVLAGAAFQINRERTLLREARQRRIGGMIVNGTGAAESGDLLPALRDFADALLLDQGDPLRATAHRLRYGSVLADCPRLTHLWFEGKECDYAQFSPDGQRVVVSQVFGDAKIYDLQTGELRGKPFGPPQLSNASYDPSGQLIVTASQEGTACIWSATNLQQILCLPHPKRVMCARFSPDSKWIVTACEDGIGRIWEVRTGKPKILLKGHQGSVQWAEFSHDGKLVATASDDKTARLWNASNGRQLKPELPHGNWVTYCAFSPDDQSLLTASLDRKARVWKVSTRERILPELKHSDGVESAQFSPDNRCLLTAGLDGTVRLWTLDGFEPLKPISILHHEKRVTYAGFSPDSRRIISTCVDGSVRVWDLAGVAARPPAVPCSFSQDGTRSLVLSNNTIVVRDVASGKETCPAIRPDSPLETAELCRNGRFLATVSLPQSDGGRQLCVWNVATGLPIAPALSYSSSLSGMALSDDGKALVVFSGKSARVWDVLARAPFSGPWLHEDDISQATFSPDGTRVATASGNTAQVWTLATGQRAYAALGHKVAVPHVEFSPDGKYLATCCSDAFFTECYAQVWDAHTGLAVGPKLRHLDGVLYMSFSPDSRRLVTASEDTFATVWEVPTGKPLTSFKHSDQVWMAVFSADSKWIVTSSKDKTARVWDVESGAALTLPMQHNSEVAGARFLAGAGRIVTWEKTGITRVWELPLEHRPASEMKSLARLLLGHAETPESKSTGPAESLEGLWQRLRAIYPEYFRVSPQEIRAWHDGEAADWEMRAQWFTAAFHLKCLLALRPEDSTLSARLANAQAQISAGSVK